jgi:hypothetical protein
MFRRLLVLLLFAPGCAHACLFATKTPPEGWFQWSSGLFAGDVTAIEKDVVMVKVAETFKGPDATHGTLTLNLSERYWSNCRVEKPALGARVLAALNANGEAMLVPLSGSYADQLRAYRIRGQGQN